MRPRRIGARIVPAQDRLPHGARIALAIVRSVPIVLVRDRIARVCGRIVLVRDQTVQVCGRIAPVREIVRV
jgi:hypothetical protein